MIRHFCDLCHREIKGEPAHFSLARKGAPGSGVLLTNYDKEICKDCGQAINDTIKSISKEGKRASIPSTLSTPSTFPMTSSAKTMTS